MLAVYLDASVVIPLVEGTPEEKPRLRMRVAQRAGDDAVQVISDLVRMECQVKPLALGDDRLLQDFAGFFASPALVCVGLTPAVCDRAAHIRAQHRYRTPDALHLAAAIEAHCDLFMTGDARLASFPDILVCLLRPG